jgi:hypothetical protein
MSKVLVYSCVTGNYDNLEAGLLASDPIAEDSVQYVLYTDRLTSGSPPQSYRNPAAQIDWELRPLLWQNPLCARRTARWHKVNSHLIPTDADYTVWLDGTQRIRSIALGDTLLKSLGTNCELASFQHPDRTCAYQEMHECIRLKKDNPTLMRRQLDQYRQAQFPAYRGLVETSCVVRKATANVIAFNQLWWQQIQEHSYRDQLSFNYAAWCLDLMYEHIPGQRLKSPFFEYAPHRHEA